LFDVFPSQDNKVEKNINRLDTQTHTHTHTHTPHVNRILQM